MENKLIFKLEDTVFLGKVKGIVVDVNTTSEKNHTYEVIFEAEWVGWTSLFDSDGRLCGTEPNSTEVLSFTPYKFVITPKGINTEGFTQERPLPVLTEGEVVLFRDFIAGYYNIGFYQMTRPDRKHRIALSRSKKGVYTDFVNCDIIEKFDIELYNKNLKSE